MVKTQRLFVAVELPDELREKVHALAAELPNEGVKVVEQQNIHLTLKFIGDFPDDKISELKSRLSSVKFKSFNCSVSGVGVFPSPDYIKVLWAGLKCDEIPKLAAEIENALDGLVKKENRPFSSHVTIARAKKKIDASEFLETHKNDNFGEFTVSGFMLMQSELGGSGPTYTVLKKFAIEN